MNSPTFKLTQSKVLTKNQSMQLLQETIFSVKNRTRKLVVEGLVLDGSDALRGALLDGRSMLCYVIVLVFFSPKFYRHSASKYWLYVPVKQLAALLGHG